MEEFAASSGLPKVASIVAVFHHVRRHIAGATLRVPPWMERYRWELEHVGRVSVQVGKRRLLVDRGHVDQV